MCAHNDARSKLKYLAYFPVQGVFRALGMDVSIVITNRYALAHQSKLQRSALANIYRLTLLHELVSAPNNH
jgi:hypothetical protein